MSNLRYGLRRLLYPFIYNIHTFPNNGQYNKILQAKSSISLQLFDDVYVIRINMYLALIYAKNH
jgi:hypothetical protein